MNNKTIVLVGVLDKVGSTNISMAKSLIKLGYTVLPISYRTIIQKYGYTFFEDYVLSILEKYKPYLTIFCKCNGIDSLLIEKCNKYTHTFTYFMDPLETLLNCQEIITHMQYSDFSSATSSDVCTYIENIINKKVYHLIQGVDTNIFKPVEYDDNYSSTVSFIGTKTKERDEYINFLRINGFNVECYGNGYSDHEVFDEEFAKICSSSRIMLSLNTFNNKNKYFSNRLPRYLACGTCTFHLDSTDTLDEYFENGKDIVYFSNKEDLLEKLNIISMEDIVNIKENGRQKVINTMTWDIKMKELLDIVIKNV